MTEQFAASAPAKINLTLHVTEQRSDGYHVLDSLVVFAQPGDHLNVSAAERDSFAITGRFGDQLEPNADNLIVRALERVRKFLPQSVPAGLSIELQKDLPIASGIGGGSADAAAMLSVLKRINALHSLPKLSEAMARKIAIEVGADVPMCMDSEPKHIVGIGDHFSNVQHLPEFYVLLANPLAGIATPRVFELLESRENPPMPSFGDGWKNLDDLVGFLGLTRNDLTASACNLMPEITKLLDSMSNLSGCKLARMTGSGATVFGIFASMDDASSARIELLQQYPDYWIEAKAVFHSGMLKD